VTVRSAPKSPVPQEVEAELQRVVERWRQLPLDHALSYAGRVRALVQSLADGVAQASGIPASAVPDLGPATLMDQLTVLVYDASAVAEATSGLARTGITALASRATPTGTPVTGTSETGKTVTGKTMLTSTLAHDLATLRRELR
jgi:hypothetical protein